MIEPSKKTGIAEAHSKLILMGEHAVVYRKPAIAIPFPILNASSIIEKTNSKIIYINSHLYNGPADAAPTFLQGIVKSIDAVLTYLQKPKMGFTIHIKSEIPIGRGLGSSAAIALAVIKAVFQYFQVRADKSLLLKFVEIAEKHAHGNPSGIDMEAAYEKEPIWFIKGEKTDTIKIKCPFFLVVADTGRFGETYAAVSSIREKYESNRRETELAINKIADATFEAKMALQSGRLPALGQAMNEAQRQLTNLGVSDNHLDNLIALARQKGALGAKLTGGGRGGCMIALTDSLSTAEGLAQQLLAGGASQAWAYQVQSTD
ncbi:mevalonate kinase [Bacillus kwashiorkori]|uniref:mevalonate kinase n=1 Tax=Bacillus kwashiorkori TaxID=1522318 RepID=UPI0007846F6D|nr:mevalonate kinase [Bacillus kwashiorkori]